MGLLFAVDLDSVADFIGKVGVPVSLCVGVILILGWVAYRLVGPKGFITKAHERHVVHIDRLDESLVNGSKMLTDSANVQEMLAACQTKQIETLDKLEGRTAAHGRCQAITGDALVQIGEKVGTDVKPHVDAIKREIRAANGG